ncbi:MAG: hypothetical protein M0P57_10040 [Syntrophales bacterium]|nr:hypothetical protein [Syntrophales bacterium]
MTTKSRILAVRRRALPLHGCAIMSSGVCRGASIRERTRIYIVPPMAAIMKKE